MIAVRHNDLQDRVGPFIRPKRNFNCFPVALYVDTACIPVLLKLGFKYEQHEQLCMKKSKDDFCPVVDCQLDQARKLCPGHCNNAKQGDIMISETILSFHFFYSDAPTSNIGFQRQFFQNATTRFMWGHALRQAKNAKTGVVKMQLMVT